MFQPGVMGAGIGLSGRADGEAAIVIYVNKDAGTRPFLPGEGTPVTVILTDQFVAFQAELGHGSGDSWPNLNFSIYDLGHVV